jgi:hypothetical protein
MSWDSIVGILSGGATLVSLVTRQVEVEILGPRNLSKPLSSIISRCCIRRFDNTLRIPITVNSSQHEVPLLQHHLASWYLCNGRGVCSGTVAIKQLVVVGKIFVRPAADASLFGLYPRNISHYEMICNHGVRLCLWQNQMMSSH